MPEMLEVEAYRRHAERAGLGLSQDAPCGLLPTAEEEETHPKGLLPSSFILGYTR